MRDNPVDEAVDETILKGMELWTTSTNNVSDGIIKNHGCMQALKMAMRRFTAAVAAAVAVAATVFNLKHVMICCQTPYVLSS